MQDVSEKWKQSDAGLAQNAMPDSHSQPGQSEDDSESDNDLELLASQGEENEDFTKGYHLLKKCHCCRTETYFQLCKYIMCGFILLFPNFLLSNRHMKALYIVSITVRERLKTNFPVIQ